MPSQKKKVPASNCEKCGKPLKLTNLYDNLCTKCRSHLPECFGCHAIMAPQYGYMYGPGRKVGKHEICSNCDYELNKKGYLHISHGKIDKFLMPNGRITITSPY